MWLSVALIEGKKLVRLAANSSAVSSEQARSKRWFAHALLYASVVKWCARDCMRPPQEETAAQGAAVSVACEAGSADRTNRDRLLALRAVLRLELDLLVLLQGLEARPLDFREVGEEILAAAVGFDEAEAFGIVEPLHGSDRKSTRLNSSHLVISYAVFCLQK